MATDKNGKWLGLGVGDVDDPNTPRTAPNWDAITLLQQKLHDKYSWARAAGITVTGSYDTTTAVVVEQFCQRVGLPVIADPNGHAVANLAMRTRLGSYPPPPPPTHAMFTVRGTGGIIGQDYTSQIAQALPAVYHEHPIDYAASMGGIPVGASTSGPSGNEAADQATQMLADAVMGSTVTFAVSGYSLGTKGVVQFLDRLFDPNDPLYVHRNRLVCVVLVADPWRPFGKSFYLGPIASGQGIGTPYFTMSKAAQDALGYRCCWLVQENDLYTNSPLGATGQVLADCEQIVLGTALSDPLGTMGNAVKYLLQLVIKDGGLQTVLGGTAAPVNEPPGASAGGGLLGGLGGILTGVLGGGASGASLLTGIASGSTLLTPTLAGLLLPVLVGGFEGILSGALGNGSNLPPGVAADAQAAVLALKFYGGGIQGHLTYHANPWSANSPQTFLQLGIQHAADWGSRVPVTV